MLIGRDTELGRADEFLSSLLSDGGGSFLIRGQAGIGKSAVLAELARRAAEREMRVLSTSGVEGESQLAFAGLGDLLGSLHDQFTELPPPQLAALEGALALGPPAPGERFAVCAAAHSVLRSAAAGRPTLVAVDDIHWLDEPSRECLLFAARRSGAGLGLAFTERIAEGAQSPPGLPTALAGRAPKAAKPRWRGPALARVAANALDSPHVPPLDHPRTR